MSVSSGKPTVSGHKSLRVVCEPAAGQRNVKPLKLSVCSIVRVVLVHSAALY